MNQILRWSALSILALAVHAVEAQVLVTVEPKAYKANEPIQAAVENRVRLPVTVCLEVGQTSKINDAITSTPHPFFMQRNSNGKWSTLLNGPDVGSYRGSIALQPGEKRNFKFALNDAGKIRVGLEYWRGQEDSACKSGKRPKKAFSAPFQVLP